MSRFITRIFHPWQSSNTLADQENDEDSENLSLESTLKSPQSEDHSSTKDDEDSSSDEESEAPEATPNKDGMSAYEKLRIERIRRNQERLAQLGLTNYNATKRKPIARKRKERTLPPQRSQPKRSAKDKPPPEKIDLRRRTHKILREKVPNKYSLRYSCGECNFCLREEDCGTCVFCTVNRRQDAGELVATRSRRRCLFKYCLRRLVDVDAHIAAELRTKRENNAKDESSSTPSSSDEPKREADPKTETEDESSSPNSSDEPKLEADPKTETEDEPASLKTTTQEDPLAPYLETKGSLKWLDEFYRYLRTIPHGTQHKVSGQKNADSIVSQISKLVSGQGVTYHLWPEGVSFQKGIKIHLGMNLYDLHVQAIEMETKYLDLRKGSLLRHPIAKLICFKEWIQQGKPIVKPIVSSPVPPETLENDEDDDDVSSDEHALKDQTKVAMRFEECIKPNRIRWATKDIETKKEPSPRASRSRTKLVLSGAIKNEEPAPQKQDPKNLCPICLKEGDLICCDKCDRGYHSNCHFPKIKEIPTGDWICRDCKPKKSYYKPKVKIRHKPKVKNTRLFQGEHDDDCYMCYLGGDLVCCDFCQKAFHLACHIPPLPAVPEGIWKCCECSALERTKMSRCGECKACLREECGNCKHCLDKPKYGGSNTIRQVCVEKVCPYPRLAPPASIPAKRGRPRKSLDNSTNGSKGLDCTKPLNGIKRGRGRPRKSETLESQITPVKRGRGRPRKSLETNPTESSPKKRGPGRPRKSEIEGRLKITENQPKKRGRPRKIVEEATPKKKRGRPRKSLDEPSNDAPVKKRGRPRKSTAGDLEPKAKRIKSEPKEEGPVIFKFKISAFKSVYSDPISIKIRKIIKNAVRDPNNSKVVDKTCELLRRCAKSPENVEKIILFGGVEVLCNAMRDHPDKCILQAEACCTFAELLWVFPAVSKKLIHMGVLDLITTALDQCPKNAKVQQMGSAALGAFSYDVHHLKHLETAGSLRAVIRAMKRFPGKLAVQKEGCYFLQNFVVRSEDTFVAVSESEIIPILAEAIVCPEADSEFLLPVFGLLGNLALNLTVKSLLGKANLISSILSIANATPDLEVKQAACSALRNLAIENLENQKQITTNDGVDIVLNFIDSYTDDSLLLIVSLNLLKELSIHNDEIAHDLAQKRGVKLLLKAMESHRDLPALQIAACELIGYLLIEGRNQTQGPKIANAILSAMKIHDTDEDVQIHACDALFELSRLRSTRLILKKKGSKALLLNAKENFPDCESDVDDILAAVAI